jgi:hypothetical protein
MCSSGRRLQCCCLVQTRQQAGWFAWRVVVGRGAANGAGSGRHCSAMLVACPREHGRVTLLWLLFQLVQSPGCSMPDGTHAPPQVLHCARPDVNACGQQCRYTSASCQPALVLLSTCKLVCTRIWPTLLFKARSLCEQYCACAGINRYFRVAHVVAVHVHAHVGSHQPEEFIALGVYPRGSHSRQLLAVLTMLLLLPLVEYSCHLSEQYCAVPLEVPSLLRCPAAWLCTHVSVKHVSLSTNGHMLWGALVRAFAARAFRVKTLRQREEAVYIMMHSPAWILRGVLAGMVPACPCSTRLVMQSSSQRWLTMKRARRQGAVYWCYREYRLAQQCCQQPSQARQHPSQWTGTATAQAQLLYSAATRCCLGCPPQAAAWWHAGNTPPPPPLAPTCAGAGQVAGGAAGAASSRR